MSLMDSSSIIPGTVKLNFLTANIFPVLQSIARNTCAKEPESIKSPNFHFI